jgi:Uma2 family endonuclease
MTPASIAQRRIARNLSELLNHEFETWSLDLFAYIGAAVRVRNIMNFQSQPDIAVVPGVAGYNLYSERFQLVGEVLSPTNTRNEIDLKLRRYREAPDNLYAVVIEPREFLVEIYVKRENWQSKIFKQADDVIEMPEFGLRCCVLDLYRGTPLDPERSGA